MIFISLATGIFAINSGLHLVWTSPLILGSIFICLLILFLFNHTEKNHQNPIIDLSAFKEKSFSCANIAATTLMIAFAGATIIFPFFFEYVMSLSAATAGTILTAPSIAMIVANPFSRFVSSFMMTVQNTGASIGIAVLEWILIYLMIIYSGSIPFNIGTISKTTLVQSFYMTFLSGTLFCVFGLISSLLIREKKEM